MLRSFTALFLITALLSANFTQLFIYAGFDINQKYIASKLCENRNKPWMHCNGKCYLAKKIRLAEEKEKGQERESHKSHFQEAFISENIRLKFPMRLLRLIKPGYKNFILPQHTAAIFHPPQA